MTAPLSRRHLLKGSVVTAAALGLSRFTARSYGQIIGSNEAIRMGVIGFNGRGVSHIEAWSNIRGVRLAALCDADQKVLDRTHEKAMKGDFIRKSKLASASPTTQPGAGPTTHPSVGDIAKYGDLRRLLDDKNIDAISTATPNHWHSLITIWGCQAGKDVYVEKPISHNVWEGRQAVAAARKYNRIVQAGTQSRSSKALTKGIAWIQEGNLGKVKYAHAMCYKRRGSIGKVSATPPVPANINLDLWCGPTPLEAPHRKQFHYDWHWFWNTGNGDIGNQGIHQMDIARWGLGKDSLSSSILSVGGRFGYDDDGQTPNTQFAIHDYGDAMLIFEVRGLPRRPGSPKMDTFYGQNCGQVIFCEDGYLAGTTAYDNDHKELMAFGGKTPATQPASSGSPASGKSSSPEDNFQGDHFANFITAVRSRKQSDLHADIEKGHLSSALCHTANISYRLGAKANPNEIREAVLTDSDTLNTFERFRDHLAVNNVDIAIDKATLGVPLKMDPKTERFTNNEKANDLLRDPYRAPFVVPDEV